MPDAEPSIAAADGLTTAVLERYANSYPRELATQLAQLSTDEIAEVCTRLSDRAYATLLAKLPDSLSDKLIRAASPEQAARWVVTAPADDAAAISGRMSARQRERVLHVGGQDRLLLERLGSLQASGLARLLQVDFLRVQQQSTKEDIVVELKRRGDVPHRSIFVCDAAGRYIGIIELSRALTAEAHIPASSLLRKVQPVPVAATITGASKMAGWRLHRELPVVDERKRLVGSLLWGDLQRALAAAESAPFDSSTYPSLQHGLELVVTLLTQLVNLAIRPRRLP